MKKILFVILNSLLCACVSDILPEDISENLEYVSVNIQFSAENELMTKGTSDAVIKNMWIIQFDGSDDNARILGTPTYISDLSGPNCSVQLVQTKEDVPGLVCFIANSFEKVGELNIDRWTTLADFKRLYKSVSCEADVFGEVANGTEYIILYGETRAQITSQTKTLSVNLCPNVAKVTFEVTIGNVSGLQIQSVQLCSVPSVSYYAVDQTKEGLFPSTRSFDRINYDSKPWTAGAASMSFEAYLPVNLRGASVSTTSQDKARYAPFAATCLLVNAMKTEGGKTIPMTYTFYLGGDDNDNYPNDYNVRAGSHYTYKFNVGAIGNPKTDSRVKRWDVVDFTDQKYGLANSYILNPIPSGNAKRIFRIPIGQITTFWTEYEESTAHNLLEGEWKSVVLAADFNVPDEKFEVFNPIVDNDNPYFEVAVAPGLEGNVVVGIEKVGQAVSWSWHLWITDYDPYSCFEFEDSVSGQYIYTVSGGYVHRYADSPDLLTEYNPDRPEDYSEDKYYWLLPKNSRQYIMDRNLGALSGEKYPIDNRGLLYYQYGRKDPFFFDGINKITNTDDLSVASINYSNIEGGAAVKYSVENPQTYILKTESPYSWTREEKYVQDENGKMNSIIWNDRKAVHEYKDITRKSIFDPCPPGFRVPSYQVWKGFTPQGAEGVMNETATTNVFMDGSIPVDGNTTYSRGFMPFLEAQGLRYWPYEENNKEGSEYPYIYIPASGYKERNSLKNRYYLWGSDEAVNCNLWTEYAAQSNNLGTYSLTIRANLLDLSSDNRARTMPVRCITDRSSALYQ